MSCQVTYKENNTFDIKAPNGNPSILYDRIKNMEGIESENQALRTWLRIYTKSFKDWYGVDWESISDKEKKSLMDQGYLDPNGEPAIFYRGDYSKSERYNYSNSVGIFNDNTYIAQNSNQAQAFITQTKERVFPVFLRPGKSINFNSVTEFQKAVVDFYNSTGIPSNDMVKGYVEAVHAKENNIIGSGIFGKEYNTYSKENIKSVFGSSLKIASSPYFDEYSIAQQYLNEDYQKIRKSTKFIEQFITRLAENLGIDLSSVKMVDADGAKLATIDAKNPWNGQPAFFYKNNIYLLKDQLTYESAFHEFAHPLVRSIAQENKKLFDRIYQDIISTTQGKTLLAEALEEYGEYSPTSDLIKEEVVVKAMTHVANTKGLLDESEKASSGIINAIKKLLYAIKQILRKAFKTKKGIKDLNESTSLEDLANMLIDDTWAIDMSILAQDDLVAYMHDLNNHVEDLMKAYKTEDGRLAVHQQLVENANVSIRQLREMEQSGQYEELKIVLSDVNGRSDYDQMRENMKAFNTKAKVRRAYEQRIDELEEFKKRVQALALNLRVIDDSVKRMGDHIKELRDDPDQKKALGNISFYVKSMDQWDLYLERFLEKADQSDIDTKSSVVQDISTIRENISRARRNVNSIYKNSLRDVLFDIWEPMNKQIEKSKNEEIAKLKKELDKLKEKGGSRGKFLSNKIDKIQEETKEALVDKDKMLDYITGRMGDIGMFHAWTENFIANQDPSISSFAMYIKKNISDVQVATHNKYNRFVSELDPVIKKMGVSPSQLNKFSEKFLFVDKSYRRDEKGDLVEYPVYTFLNPFKNYKFEVAKMKEEIGNAEAEFEGNPSEENRQKFIDTVNRYEEHTKYFFNKENIDEYYHADDILDKSVLGRKAKQMIEEKLSEINVYQSTHQDDYEIYEDYETVEQLWKEYKQLFSLYDEYGKKKTGDDLKIAELLQEHREAKREFYEYDLIEGAFENSLKAMEMKLVIKLQDEGFVQNTDAFEQEFEKRRETWIKRNSHIKIKDEFYVIRNNILDRIREILESVPGNQDFSILWEEILDSLQGRRDRDGQPVGTELTEEHLALIKDIEQQIEDAKRNVTGVSGLTPKEMESLRMYFAALKRGVELTYEQNQHYRKLLDKKSKLGVGDAVRIELTTLFEELRELQTRRPTEYYMNIVGEYYFDITGQELPDDDELLSDKEFIDSLLEQNEDFKNWWMNNHIVKEGFNPETGEDELTYQRTYAWSVVVPNDPSYYERTEINDEDGNYLETINGVPNLKFYKRNVKDEYKTGYNPKTGKVELQVGTHKDITGQWLPKSLEDMQVIKERYADKLADQPYTWDNYINYDYTNLQQEDPTTFQALEIIKKFHLESQENLGKNTQLGLELPRFRKDFYEYTTSGKLKDDAVSKWEELAKGFMQAFGRKKDDFEEGLNFDEQMTLVDLDVYSGQEGRIPIRGKYNLELSQVSRDITTSIFNYYQSAEQSKKLKELQPIANAMKKMAENNPSDMKKIQKMSYLQRKQKEYLPGNSNRRKKVIDSIVEVVFEGKKLFEGSNNPTVIKAINNSLGMASHAFFAFDVTSAMKNFLGAQFQIALEGAGNKYFRYRDWHRGRPWAYSAMWEITGQIYKTTAKSKKVQLIEIFDAIQGRFEDKFGESLSRSFARDAANFSWTTSHRKWLETEATLQLFSAIMHSTKVMQVTNEGVKKIRYIDAWEINPETNSIQLKDGIDSAWDIGGQKFNDIKFRNHEVSNLLQGAYSQFDQPMVNRFIIFRLVSSMRKYFTKMLLHRYGHRGSLWDPKERYNLPTNDMHMGYYMRNIQTFKEAVQSRGRSLLYMTPDQSRAFKMGFLELFKLWLISASYMWIWGFDPDDSDKWKKLQGKIPSDGIGGSGALPTPITDKEWTENFNPWGWVGNNLLLLSMHVEAENEHFIPWPTHGLSDMYNVVLGDASVSAVGSFGTMINLFTDLVQTMNREDRQWYQKDAGALDVQQTGENKFWIHLFKAGGIKGKAIDPVTSLKNFYNARRRGL